MDNFLQAYRATYGGDNLSEAFLTTRFPNLYDILNRYVVEKTGGVYHLPLDETLAYDVWSYLNQLEDPYPTAENLDIISKGFLVQKMAENDATIKKINDNQRIKDEKLWRRPTPYGLNSRVEDPNKEHAAGVYMFARPRPYRKEWLEWIGVGVPRNRQEL